MLWHPYTVQLMDSLFSLLRVVQHVNNLWILFHLSFSSLRPAEARWLHTKQVSGDPLSNMLNEKCVSDDWSGLQIQPRSCICVQVSNPLPPPYTSVSPSSTLGMMTHSVYIFTRPLMYILLEWNYKKTQQNVKLLTQTEWSVYNSMC